MRKYLTRIGDSLGIVFERPALDLIGLTEDTPLEVTWDGTRLVLEPVRDPAARREVFRPAPAPSVDFTVRANTVPILDELEKKHGMDNARVRELHHLSYANIEAHRKYCLKKDDAGKETTFHPGATNVQTANRLFVAREKLRAGASWDEAVAEALRMYPK